MSPTLTRSPAPRAPSRRLRLIAPVLAAALAVAALAVGPPSPAARTVERLTIVNSHDWWANVEVTDAERRGRLGLLGVNRNDTRTLHEVIDHGSIWVITQMLCGGEVGFGDRVGNRGRWFE